MKIQNKTRNNSKTNIKRIYKNNFFKLNIRINKFVGGQRGCQIKLKQ